MMGFEQNTTHQNEPKNYTENQWKTVIEKVMNSIDYFGCCKLKSDRKAIKYQIGFQSCTYQHIQLKSIWNFQPKDQNFLLQIKTIDIHLYLANQHTPNEASFAQSVSQYVQRLNLKYPQVKGVFYTEMDKKFILCYRAVQPLSVIINQLACNFYVNETYKFFKAELAKFIDHFQLTNQKKRTSPKPQSKKQFQTITKMAIVKEHIEVTRQNRQKSTHISLAYNQLKTFGQMNEMKICFIELNKFKGPEYVSKAQIKSIYESQKTFLKEENKSKQKVEQKYILSGIDIRQAESQIPIVEGGYSKIFMGLYSYTILYTINNYQNYKFDTEKDRLSAQKRFKWISGYLIKKQAQSQAQIQSLQNEHRILKFLRGQKFEFFANYYMEVPKGQNQSTKQIFLDMYNTTLFEMINGKCTKRKKLKVLKQIISSIGFLQQQKILHRDLKQRNIMIDNQGNIRVIDFGSSCGFYGNRQKQFEAAYNTLRSTRNYFLCYQDVNGTSFSDRYTQDQFERSPFFDIYSFGQIILSIFSVELINLTNNSDMELLYLAMKCKELNPEDRLDVQQIKIYLNLIINLYLEQTKIDNDKKVRSTK